MCQKARFPIVGFIPDVGGIAALYLGKQKGKGLSTPARSALASPEDLDIGTEDSRTPVTREQKPIRRRASQKPHRLSRSYSLGYRDITADGLLRQSSLKRAERVGALPRARAMSSSKE